MGEMGGPCLFLYHVLSIPFLSLQHDFEAALAAKDAIIEQLRRDLREMQAKLDVSGEESR